MKVTDEQKSDSKSFSEFDLGRRAERFRFIEFLNEIQGTDAEILKKISVFKNTMEKENETD